MSQLQIRVHQGKVLDPALQLKDLFSSLPDGEWIVSVVPVNPLVTVEDYRRAYFSMIDECVMHTGHKKYEIHDMFKSHKEIVSTRDFELVDWIEYLKAFRWWCYNVLNLMV